MLDSQWWWDFSGLHCHIYSFQNHLEDTNFWVIMRTFSESINLGGKTLLDFFFWHHIMTWCPGLNKIKSVKDELGVIFPLLSFLYFPEMSRMPNSISSSFKFLSLSQVIGHNNKKSNWYSGLCSSGMYIKWGEIYYIRKSIDRKEDCPHPKDHAQII